MNPNEKGIKKPKKKSPPNLEPPSNLLIEEEKEEAQSPFIEIVVNKDIIKKYKIENIFDPLMKAAKIPYDFPKNHFDEKDFVIIDKKAITLNELTPVRFDEEKTTIEILTKTALQRDIDKFLEDIYNKAVQKKTYWITGSSGIGKTYCISINVLKQRNKHSNERILQHMILTDQYLTDFKKSFLQDLVYAFATCFNDPQFPACPKI